MRVLLQRVRGAQVNVRDSVVARIKSGLLLLVGIGKDDGIEDIEWICKKVINLRIFEDEYGKMNLNVRQVNGEILSVPQFTLYADISKGNRPGFESSAEHGIAKEYWEKFNALLRQNSIIVEEGVFGAHMEVELINDGPVTIWLDSKGM